MNKRKRTVYELGFKHPQHFTRMFKKSVGMSPSEYRNDYTYNSSA
ncbi:AraC family transcriptional regulator [Labilibaculum sp.]|nr:AraC family transcriptional regulator [Labilibaculum sp.]